MSNLLSKTVCAVALLLPSMTVVAQTPQDQTKRVDALEQQVRQYLEEQKPQLAIPLLRQIVALDPTNVNAHGNLGVLLYFQGQFSDAIPEMSAALEMRPDLWKIKALRGIAEKRTGDPRAAESDLEDAFPHLDDKKFEKEAGLELVELEASFEEFAKALIVTEKLEEFAPGDPQILFVSYEISSQMTDQSVVNMLVAAPESAEMHMIMGNQLARQGDHANAIAQYREAIRLNPGVPGAHFELAEQLRASADPALNAQAESEFRAAVEANQYDEKSWRRLGESAAEKGDFKGAQEDYKKALALEPRDSDAQTDLAIALISLNQTSEAIPLLESAVKDDPTNFVAHYRLSVLYRRAGRTSDAQHEMDEFTHYKGLKDKMGQVFQQLRAPASPM
jgi:tetratricopeptide (TPR) repeat protein